METNLQMEPKAKVFISCGQRKKDDELQTAREIGKRLSELGFEYYIALEEQTLRGVKDNIFRQLESSEYFIFIDFKREKIGSSSGSKGKTEYRGSLFSHQELALASFLDMPLLAFQEKGVKQEDGIMRYLQANSIQFTDKHLLADVVSAEITKRGWKPSWKNVLLLERNSDQQMDMNRIETIVDAGVTKMAPIPARFFHINVKNLHPTKTAFNCYVYLERAKNLLNDIELPLETVEFKWAGIVMPNANIFASSQRAFDAVWFAHNAPDKPRFNTYSDSGRYIPEFRIAGKGRYELTYLVVSENFPPARSTFLLQVGNHIEDFRLQQLVKKEVAE